MRVKYSSQGANEIPGEEWLEVRKTSKNKDVSSRDRETGRNRVDELSTHNDEGHRGASK